MPLIDSKDENAARFTDPVRDRLGVVNSRHHGGAEDDRDTHDRDDAQWALPRQQQSNQGDDECDDGCDDGKICGGPTQCFSGFTPPAGPMPDRSSPGRGPDRSAHGRCERLGQASWCLDP